MDLLLFSCYLQKYVAVNKSMSDLSHREYETYDKVLKIFTL